MLINQVNGNRIKWQFVFVCYRMCFLLLLKVVAVYTAVSDCRLVFLCKRGREREKGEVKKEQ